MVAKRGAAVPYDELDYSSLTWGRVLDDMSSASVTVDSDASCCPLLGDLREWRDEIWIYRDNEEVWRGPLTPQPSYSETQTVVAAKDLLAWFERRFADDPISAHANSLTRLVVYRNVDATVAFVGVLNQARRRDHHPALDVKIGYAAVPLDEFHADLFQRPRAADILRTLAKLGVDFTFIGQTIYFGAPEIDVPDLSYLTSDVVSGVTVTPIPSASEVTIIGSNADNAGEPFTATVGYGGRTANRFDAGYLGINPDIGLVIEEANSSDLNSQELVNRAAQTRYDFYQGDPLSASFTLDSQAPVTIAQLIPGAKVRLDIGSTCRTLSGVYRLTKVDVSAGIDGTETVAVEVHPLGTENP